MLKSIGVVVGSYLLSVILVLATDTLLSRLFAGEFVKGSVTSDAKEAHKGVHPVDKRNPVA